MNGSWSDIVVWSLFHDTCASPASPSTSLQDWCSLPKVAMSDFGCLSCCCHCPPCSTLHLCFLCNWAYSWLYNHSFEREKQRIRTLVSYIRSFNQLKYPLRSFSLEDFPGYTFSLVKLSHLHAVLHLHVLSSHNIVFLSFFHLHTQHIYIPHPTNFKTLVYDSS
jgi:hypothetical protein